MRDPEDHDGYCVALELCTYADGERLDDIAARADLAATWLRDIDCLFGNLEFGQA